jgi:hypothetical protein
VASLFSCSLPHVLPRFRVHCRMFFSVFVFIAACSSPFSCSLPHVLPRFRCRMFFLVFVFIAACSSLFFFSLPHVLPRFVFIAACYSPFFFIAARSSPYFFIVVCSSPFSFSLPHVLLCFCFHCRMFFPVFFHFRMIFIFFVFIGAYSFRRGLAWSCAAPSRLPSTWLGGAARSWRAAPAPRTRRPSSSTASTLRTSAIWSPHGSHPHRFVCPRVDAVFTEHKVDG